MRGGPPGEGMDDGVEVGPEGGGGGGGGGKLLLAAARAAEMLAACKPWCKKVDILLPRATRVPESTRPDPTRPTPSHELHSFTEEELTGKQRLKRVTGTHVRIES